MAGIRKDLQMIRGTSRTFRVTAFDPNTTNKDPISIAGATVEFRLKLAVTVANPALIEKTSTIPAEILILAQSGDTLGQADIFIDPVDTSSLAPDLYVYDVFVTLVGGKVHDIILPSDFLIEQAVNE